MIQQAGYDYSREMEQLSGQPETRAERRVVKRIYQKTDNRKKVLVKGVVMLFVYALVLVYLCIKSSTLGYQIVQLENDIHNLETANLRLQYEIQETCSLQHIEQVAINDLGMHKANKQISIAAIEKEITVDETDKAEENVDNPQVGEKVLKKLYSSLKVLAENSF